MAKKLNVIHMLLLLVRGKTTQEATYINEKSHHLLYLCVAHRGHCHYYQ